MEKNSEFNFSYSYEYLDLARHSHDEAYLKDVTKYFKAKYSKHQPDFIITDVNCYSLISKGETAGSVVLDILKGNKPANNEVIRATSRIYTFDWRQLKRWGIDENKLPPSSIIQYREKSVWEVHIGYIIGIFF